MSKNYVTVGMYRIPYSTRTLALDGKTRFRARLTKEVDPSTGKRKEVEILALSLEECELPGKVYLDPVFIEYLLP